MASAKQKAASRRNIKKAQKARKKTLRIPRKVNKRRRSNPGVAKKSGHRHKVQSKAGKFLKGFLGGGGAGQLADDVAGLATDNPLITVPTKVIAASIGGYYVGGKNIEGLIGGVASVGLDLGLRALAGRTTTGVSRFRL